MLKRLLLLFLGLASMGYAAAARPLKAVVVDGQNNHDWQATTPVLKRILEDARFKVEVVTTPATGQGMNGFNPRFASYDLVVLNYVGDPWPSPVQAEFVKYVESGGGVVVFHAANNAFPEWKEFNEIIGVGGWGNRDERSGPYLRLRNGRWVHDQTPGKGGSHGKQHEFVVETFAKGHPITAGLPDKWLHAKDELYDRLRGPALNVTVLASAYSAPQLGGSGEHEPVLLTIRYGKGRVFHTALGHGPEAMSCVGFIVTLQRGSQWAAAGKVLDKSIPADFPKADRVSTR